MSHHDCCWGGSHSGTQCTPTNCPSLGNWVLSTASGLGWFTFLPNHCGGRTRLESLSSPQVRSPMQGYPDQSKGWMSSSGGTTGAGGFEWTWLLVRSRSEFWSVRANWLCQAGTALAWLFQNHSPEEKIYYFFCDWRCDFPAPTRAEAL